MLKGFAKEDPPVQKKEARAVAVTVEVGIPQLLRASGMPPFAEVKDAAVADLTVVAFYYLLRVDEYTVK
jgi:hypothetical protein